MASGGNSSEPRWVCHGVTEPAHGVHTPPCVVKLTSLSFVVCHVQPMSAHCNTRTSGALDALLQHWAPCFCNALLQQGFHHAAASGASSRPTVIAPVFGSCTYCERNAVTMCPGLQSASRQRVFRRLAEWRRSRGSSRSGVSAQSQQKADWKGAVQVSSHDSPSHTRVQKTQISIIMLQRACKSGASDADRWVLGAQPR